METAALIRFVAPSQIGSPARARMHRPRMLTRRQVLVSGMLSAAAAPALVRASGLSAEVDFDFGARKITLTERLTRRTWVVDIAKFDGAPSIRKVETNGVRKRFALHGALFPGTTASADIDVECRRLNGRWLLRLKSDLAGEFPEIDLADWLRSAVHLQVRTTRAQQWRVRRLATIEAPKGSEAAFDTAWTYQWRSRDIIRIRYSSYSLHAHEMRGGLENLDTASCMKQSRWSRRAVWRMPTASLLAVRSDGQIRIGERRLQMNEAVAADVALESGTANADATAVLCVETAEHQRFGALIPLHAAHRGANVALRRLRWTALHDARLEIEVTAQIERGWLHGQHASFGLTNPGNEAALVIHVRPGTSATATCRAAVDQVAAAVEDTTFAMLRPREGAPGEICDVDDLAAGKFPPRLLDSMQLHVERLADQLQLAFEFKGVDLIGDHAGLRIVNRAGVEGLMRVLFPAQHLLEQTFPDPATGQTVQPDLACEDVLTGELTAKVRLAGRSRLVFSLWAPAVKDRERCLDLTLRCLLNWCSYTPRLAPRAIPSKHDYERYKQAVLADDLNAPPGDDYTSIEFPTDVYLSSVDDTSQWRHTRTPGGAPGGPVELWRTSLENAEVRALWTEGFRARYFPPPYGSGGWEKEDPYPVGAPPVALTPKNRTAIVLNSSIFGLRATPGKPNVQSRQATGMERTRIQPSGDIDVFIPEPIRIERLHLSMLGATVRLRGEWDPWVPYQQEQTLKALNLSKWQQRTVLGRDCYVEVQSLYFAMPLGALCALVKIVERKIARDPQSGRLEAALFERYLPLFLKPEKAYPALAQPDLGRDWPMTRVEFPGVPYPFVIRPDDPANHALDPYLATYFAAGDVFWPRASRSQPVEFIYEALHEGGRTRLRGPLLFVGYNVVVDPDRSKLRKVLEYYETYLPAPCDSDAANTDWRVHAVSGSPITYAPSAQSGDTQLETTYVDLRARYDEDGDLAMTPALIAADQPPFYPSLFEASVRLEALRRLSSRAIDTVRIAYDRDYVRTGFSKTTNVGEVYARLRTPGVKLNVAADTKASGGVAAPNAVVVALSRKTGLVGGDKLVHPQSSGGAAAARFLMAPAASQDAESDVAVQSMREGRFDPVAYFSGALGDAKLLGVVKLADLVKAAMVALDLERAPKLVESYLFDFAGEGFAAIKERMLAGFGEISKRLTAIETELQIPAVTQRLQDRIAALAASVNGLPAPDHGEFVGKCTALAKQTKAALKELEAIARDPASLLASAFPQFFGELQRVVDAVKKEDFAALLDVQEQAKLRDEIEQLVPVELLRRHEQFKLRLAQTRAELKDKADSLRGEVYVLLAQAFDQYLELAERGRQFAAVAELVSPAALADLLKSLWLIPKGAQDRFVLALAALDRVIRQLPQKHELSVVRRIADELYRGTNALRGRLLWINAHLEAAQNMPNPSIKEVLEWAEHQSELIANVAAALKLIEVAEIALAAAANDPAVASLQNAKDNIESLRKDVGELRRAIDDTAKHCSDAWHVINGQGGAEGYGTALRAVLVSFASIANVPLELRSSVEDGQAAVKAVKSLLTDQSSAGEVLVNAVTQYLTGQAQIAWICSLIVRGADCFGGQQERCELLKQLTGAYEGRIVALLADSFGSPVVQAIASVAANIQTSEGFNYVAADLRGAIEELSRRCSDYQAIPEAQLRPLVNTYKEILARAQRIFTSLREIFERGALSKLVDVEALVASVLGALPLPTHLNLSYDWDSPLGPWPGSSPIFVGRDSPSSKITIASRTQIDLLGKVPATFSVEGRIQPFILHLLNSGSAKFFSITIDELSFSAGAGRKSQYTVKVGQVALSDKFEFIQKLQAFFATTQGEQGGDGFYYRPQLLPPALEVGYAFGFDIISFGAFSLQNLRLMLSFVLPFDNRPARLRFAVSEKQCPCLISAGVYGGGAFFGITARADGVELVEGAFEFGAVTAIRFGPLKGSGRVTAGFYFSCGPGGGVICGYVVAFGQGKIACFSLSICLRVEVCSRGPAVDGQASFKVTFRVSRFFKVSYGFTAAYKFKGGGGKAAVAGASSTAPQLAAHSTQLSSQSAGATTRRARRVPMRSALNASFERRRKTWADVIPEGCSNG